MAGAYRMALSGATVTITPAGGGPVVVHKKVTATVRDGIARARTGAAEVASMEATTMTRLTGKHYTVEGPDGTLWDVLRDCGCR